MTFIPGILKADLAKLVEDGYETAYTEQENFSIVTQLQTGKSGEQKAGALSLTKLMLDKNEARINKTAPNYSINHIPKNKSSCLYLIKCQGGCNSSVFKIGRAKYILNRLTKYRTALPLDNSLMIVAVLHIPNPSLVVACEKALIANMMHFCAKHPSKMKQLRRTEWYYRLNGTGEAMALRTMINLGLHVAKTNATMNVTLHLFGKSAFNKMQSLPNIDHTPLWTVIPKHWKGMTPLEGQIHAAEMALVRDSDDDGFTTKELASVFDYKKSKVVVEIEPITFS